MRDRLHDALTAVALATAITLGCSSPEVPRCIPGQSIPCACASGVSGAQVCLANGTYTACSCASGTDAGTDVPVADRIAPTDSSVHTDAVPTGTDVVTAIDVSLQDGGTLDAVGLDIVDASSTEIDVHTALDVVRTDVSTFQPRPCVAPGLCNVVEISMARSTNAARLANGQIWTWQWILFDPPAQYRGTPYTSLAAATSVMCGISANDSGRVYCGFNPSGGVRVADFMGAVAVAATHGRFYGINARGELWSWDPTATTIRGSIVAGVSGAREIIAGARRVCVRGASSTWECSGDGMTFAPAPEYDDAVSMTLTAERPNNGSECIVRTDGTLACRGYNTIGQLGLGVADTDIRSTFVTVPGITDAVRVVSAAETQGFCVLRASGAVLCWGRGDTIGDGNRVNRSSPTQVLGLTDAVGIWGGTSYAHRVCAQRANGRLLCWGTDSPPGSIAPFVRPAPVEVGGLPSS